MEFRSQLGRVRGLGASHEGVHHFWMQRVTGVALIPLVLWFVFAATSMVGADLETFKTWVGTHYNPVLLILLILAMFHHAQLGLQVVLEDYVHTEWLKIASIAIVKFAAIGLAVASIFSIVKIALG